MIEKNAAPSKREPSLPVDGILKAVTGGGALTTLRILKAQFLEASLSLASVPSSASHEQFFRSPCPLLDCLSIFSLSWTALSISIPPWIVSPSLTPPQPIPPHATQHPQSSSSSPSHLFPTPSCRLLHSHLVRPTVCLPASRKWPGMSHQIHT